MCFSCSDLYAYLTKSRTEFVLHSLRRADFGLPLAAEKVDQSGGIRTSRYADKFRPQ